jgi:ABC-type lipoprotein export system ATPase subunit
MVLCNDDGQVPCLNVHWSCCCQLSSGSFPIAKNQTRKNHACTNIAEHITFTRRNITGMIRTSQLAFSYPKGPSFAFPDIACAKGAHLLVLGESGTGKTTLLHLLAGLLQPSSGEVYIADALTSAMQGAALDKFRGSQIGIVFQTAHFLASLSVEDNLILPNYLTGHKSDRQRANELLKRFNLENKAQQRVHQLSVGEKQRISIARAVMNKPAVILADEPTSALDDKNAREVMKLLEEQASDSGSALIIVTHDQRIQDHFRQHISL